MKTRMAAFGLVALLAIASVFAEDKKEAPAGGPGGGMGGMY